MEAHPRLGDECAARRLAVDHTFAFQQGQRLACSHPADAVLVGKLPFGWQQRVRSQLFSGDPVANQRSDSDIAGCGGRGPDPSGRWLVTRGGRHVCRVTAFANHMV